VLHNAVGWITGGMRRSPQAQERVARHRLGLPRIFYRQGRQGTLALIKSEGSSRSESSTCPRETLPVPPLIIRSFLANRVPSAGAGCSWRFKYF
jgi:hypothetical protein